MGYFSSMDDCIHLHACRRVQSIGRKHRLLVPRYCTPECTCYQSEDEATSYVSISRAVDFANMMIEDEQVPYNFSGEYLEQYCATIGEILEKAEEKEE